MAVHSGMAEMLSSTVSDSVPSVSAAAAAAAAVATADDISKRVRKPYTITKSRESWTEQEHDKFIEALQLFDRDWKKIEAFVGSKTVIQIRSHAQKYFLKVQKNGTGQHVPPPRPKRKSAQPYPQKASKSTTVSQQMPVSASQPELNYTTGVQPATSIASASTMSAWVHHMTPPGNFGLKKDSKVGSITGGHSKDQMGSSGPSPQVMPIGQSDSDVVLRVMPDFAEVYSFLGSVFDPTAHGHREKMDEMAPIDRETVLLLMRNLSINLSSGDFEEHKLFLSVYDVDAEAAIRPSDHNIRSKSPIHVPKSEPALESGDSTFVSGICEFMKVTDDRGESEANEEGDMMLESNELQDIPLECYLNEGNLQSNEANASSEESLKIQNTTLLQECLLHPPGGSFSSGSEEDKCGPQDSYEVEPSSDCKTEAIVDRWWS